MATVNIAPNQSYDYLTTVQALAADLSINNSLWSIGDPLVPKFYYPDLVAGACFVQAPVAEQLQVQELTITAAANTVYSIQISQYDKTTGQNYNQTYTCTSLASGSTATTIGDQFRALITADTLVHIAATGTTTLILTAEAGYPVFQVASVGEGTISVAAPSTAGIPSRGTAADLALVGVTVAGDCTQCRFVHYARSGDCNKSAVGIRTIYDLYVLQSATNRAALITAIENGLANITASNAAEPENFSLINS